MRTTIACILGLAAFSPADVLAQKPRLDPAHVMGAQSCTECHGKEVDAWRATTHFKTFKDLERRPEANKIADNLDLDDLSANSLCIECHFTVQKKGARHVAISGISCESCHGAARDWIKEHNKETVARAARKSVSEKAGMLYPQNIYAVASNCFDCHVVDREELVNKGGHSAFSKDFDLLAWSQGEVRHSFMDSGSPVKKSGTVNREADANRKRILYMVGKLLNLEYELRAVAKATTAKGTAAAKQAYGVQHAIRANALIKEVEALNQLVPTNEVTALIAAAKSAALKTKNEAQLNAAADKVSIQAKKFVEAHDGSQLGGLDVKISALKPRGTAFTP